MFYYIIGEYMDHQKMKEYLEGSLLGQRDHLFEAVINSFHCMSRARVYAVINSVVSSMEEGELYVEVGTFQGGSLISALQGNNARAIGVDDFSEFQGTNNFEQTRANLEKFGVADRVDLRNLNFQDFFASLPADFKIQVYYYDGAHGYEAQLAGMEAAWNFLAPDAIIIVDDYLYSDVHLSVNQFIANHNREIKSMLIIDSVNDCDPIWWNGVVVLRRVG